MKKLPIGFFLTAFLCSLALLLGTQPRQGAAQEEAWLEKVDETVWETAVSHDRAEFLVYLAEQADLSAAAHLPMKEAKGAYVYRLLTDLAQRTQPPILALLQAQGAPYRRFWIANMIWVEGDAQLIESLARRDDIARIDANPRMAAQLPHNDAPDGRLPATVEPNISHVNADAVWVLGITGSGAVVGGQDTGYDWNHPGLIRQYRGWNGSVANHDYNWHDAIHAGVSDCGVNSPVPCDDNNHGTHTMGIAIGNDLDPTDPGWPAAAANAVGMAPGAEWIGCRNMREGYGTPATYSECYEWFIAPYPVGGNPMSDGDPAQAPHVINNSWACIDGEGCTSSNLDVLLGVVQNVRAAGIVTVHSAGNYGPACSSVRYPAATYDESFSVANTTLADNIYSSSSRGPVVVDGSNRLKPDISAPGVIIRSTIPGGGYSLKTGTSMSAPHVAGLVALMISANPLLAGRVDLLEQMIAETAVPLTTNEGCGGDGPADVPNNTYGWGRIDALAAVRAALNYHELELQKTASTPLLFGSDLLTYTLTITHSHPISAASNLVLTDTLPQQTALVTATPPFTQQDGVITWQKASLAANAGWQVQLVVQVLPTATGSITNSAYGVRSDEVTAVSGPAVVTQVAGPYGVFLPLLQQMEPARIP